ncbi:hypothetical protein [Flavicella sp.]
MTKNYIKIETSIEPNVPSEETINFILNYSKSLQFLKLIKYPRYVEVNLN